MRSSVSEASIKASHYFERLFVFLPHMYILTIAATLFYSALLANVDSYNVHRFVQFSAYGVSLLVAAFYIKTANFDFRLFVHPSSLSALLLSSAILAISLGAVLSIIYAEFPLWALLDLEYWILGVGILWIHYLSVRQFTLMDWRLFGLSILVLMVLFSFRSIISVIFMAPFTERITATPGFANIRMYSDLAVVFMPLSWLAMTQVRRRLVTVLLWSVNIYWAWVLLITEARSAILSLTLALFWVVLNHGVQGRRSSIVFLGVLLTSSIFYHLLPVMAFDGWARDISSSSGRMELWILSFRHFIQSFPIGIGGMMFAADGQQIASSPHNLLFLLMAEWGALVVFGFFVVIFVLIKNKPRPFFLVSPEYLSIRTPVVFAALSSTVNLQFSGAQIAPLSALSLIVAYAAWLALYFPGSDVKVTKKYVAPIVIAFLVGVFINACILGYELYQRSENSRYECYSMSGTLSPRFWVQGRLDCGYNE